MRNDFVYLALPVDILDRRTAAAKIISAELYAVFAGLADDNAQLLDQDVRLGCARAASRLPSIPGAAGAADRVRLSDAHDWHMRVPPVAA